MQIVTTFFNNEKYYMDNFLLWYRKLWNAKKFIFFIGKTVLNETNYTKNGIKFLVKTENDMTTYEYLSTTNTTDQWNNYKQVFYEIIKLNHRTFPSIWLDCDEFIYTKDINKILKNIQFKTHFYEYVPITPFKLNDNSTWCVSPWYYRSQALGDDRRISHNNCKKFTCSPDHQGEHMGSNHIGYCNNNFTPDDYENICYHIGVYSKEHYQTSKHWLQTHPNGIDIGDQLRNSGELSNIFDQFYAKCEFPTFNLNLYEKYLKS